MSVSYRTDNFNFYVCGDKTKVQQYFALFMCSAWIIEKNLSIDRVHVIRNLDTAVVNVHGSYTFNEKYWSIIKNNNI